MTRKSHHTITAYVEIVYFTGKVEEVIIYNIPCIWDWEQTPLRKTAELRAILWHMDENYMYQSFCVTSYGSSARLH